MVWPSARAARCRDHRCIAAGRAVSSPGADGAGTAILGDGELMSRMRGECALGLAWHRYALLKLGMFFGDLSLGGPQPAMSRLGVEIGRPYHHAG
jgi:hypothetical protein